VFSGQRHNLIVELALGIAQFFNWPDFPTELLNVGGQFGGIERHVRLLTEREMSVSCILRERGELDEGAKNRIHFIRG
jgi:hypothetical protein